MAEEVAKLKATIEIDSKSAQNSVNIINQRIDTLNKKMQEGEKLTAKENAELKRLVKTLADLGNSANKTQIAEEKMRATREKSANEVKNKSIINEQKLATEREKTRKATTQAEQAELRLAKQKDGLNKETNKSSGLWSTLATRFTVAGLAVNTITGLFNNLKQSIQQTSQEAINFQKDLSMVNTLSNLSKKDLEKVGKELINMGTNMGRTPEEMAKGMYAVKSITDDTVDSMKVLETATKASVAMTADLSGTVDTGVGVINAYGMEIENLEHVYDVMFKTTDIGNVTMEQLNQHLGNVVSSAVRAKVPFETLMGQLAFMTKNGIETAEATTALARAYDAIYQKNGKMKELFNIDVADPKTGKLKDTMVILEELSTVLKGYDEISQINLLDELGIEIRGQKAVQTFIEGIGDASYVLEQMSDNAGAVGRAFEQASDNIATATIKNQGKVAKAMNDFRIQNENNVIKIMEIWTRLKVFLINMMSIIANIGEGLGESNWLSKVIFFFSGGALKTKDFKNSFDTAKQSVDNFNTSIKKTSDLKNSLDTSENAFKDWAGNVAGYFQNVIDNSLTMSVETAKNILAILEAYKMVTGKVSKAQFIQTNVKDAQLMGISSTEASKIVEPVKNLGGTEDLNKSIEALKKIISKGGSGTKTVTKHYESGGKGGSIGSTGSSSDKDNELNIDKLKANIEEEVRIAKEMAKLFNASQVDLAKELEGIYKKGSETATQYKWEETATKFSDLAKKQTSIITKDEEEKKYLESKRKYIDQQEEIFKEEKEFRTRLEALGEPVTRGNVDNLIGIWEEQIINLTKLDEGVGNFTNAIGYLKNKVKTAKATLETEDLWKEFLDTTEEITNEMIDNINGDYSSYNGDNASYNTTEYEDEFAVAFRGKNSVESMNSTYDTLFEKYKGNTEALELLTDIYNNQTGSIETFSDKLSASASFVSELSSVLDNEFLSSLANAMNGISSMSSVIGNAGGIANLGFSGWASIATSALSIVSPIISSLNKSDIDDKRAEANEKFESAVETFKKTIDDMNLSERVGFANSEQIQFQNQGTKTLKGWRGKDIVVEDWTNLVSSGGGDGGSVLGGKNPTNANLDTSVLKKQLISAGYTDLANQVDGIFAGYAKYGEDRGKWGKKKSYISGYDTAGAMAEINALIEEAYRTNLDAYKEQVGLTSDSFVSAIKEGMENATALDISSMIESAFYDSYSAMIGEVFGETIGDTISETIFDVLENSGVNQSDLANMNVSEQIAYIQSLMDNSSTYLSEVFEQLGLSASKVSEEFDKIGNRDMPSLLKIGVAEVLASNTYNNSNTVVVQNAYGTIDRQFVNLTNKAVGSNMYSRTGN